MAVEQTVTKDEAASEKPLANNKATRIIEAMRKCVGKYGAAGATFDHVAREAGVSRGLLHYYFGSKEQLLIEVVRSETQRIIAATEVASETANSAQELVDTWLAQLETIIEHEPELYMLGFEMVGEGRRHPEIGAELADYNRATREGFAQMISKLEAKGAVSLKFSPLATASMLLAMANGLALQMFEDPEGDHAECVAADIDAALYMLGAPRE